MSELGFEQYLGRHVVRFGRSIVFWNDTGHTLHRSSNIVKSEISRLSSRISLETEISIRIHHIATVELAPTSAATRVHVEHVHRISGQVDLRELLEAVPPRGDRDERHLRVRRQRPSFAFRSFYSRVSKVSRVSPISPIRTDRSFQRIQSARTAAFFQRALEIVLTSRKNRLNHALKNQRESKWPTCHDPKLKRTKRGNRGVPYQHARDRSDAREPRHPSPKLTSQRNFQRHVWDAARDDALRELVEDTAPQRQDLEHERR